MTDGNFEHLLRQNEQHKTWTLSKQSAKNNGKHESLRFVPVEMQTGKHLCLTRLGVGRKNI